jgi:hypothetical protein
MQRHLIALVTGVLLLLLTSGTASATTDPAVQALGQVAENAQRAVSDATSQQQAPTNQSIDVRIFSPGDSGPVTQTNSSAASAAAANANATTQSATQAASGGTQAAEQIAANQQQAAAHAASAQQHPTNTRISVRIGSPGDDGDVSQSNSSTATGTATNANATEQSAAQRGGGCCRSAGGPPGGTQSAGQAALSRQQADARASSAQVEPSNTAIAVRIGSPGRDGAVRQSNSSTATGRASNADHATQDAEQVDGGSCGCAGPVVQALGQKAANEQDAHAGATSAQLAPSNRVVAVRIGSPGDDGSVDQSNRSTATADAANANRTGQVARQDQEGDGCGCPTPVREERAPLEPAPGEPPGPRVQAAGQFAVNDQRADGHAASWQLAPSNASGSLRVGSEGGGGSVSQANDAVARTLAGNASWLSQLAEQSQ